MGNLFTWVFIGMLLLITLAATIEPMKETLDNARGYSSTGLNCPGTPDYNVTAFNNQNTFEKLVYRPTCFATGLTMVYFVGAILVAVVVWVYARWSKK